MTYNCIKETWTVTELEAQLVQEEERQKMNKGDEAHVITPDSKGEKKEAQQ